MRRGRRAGARKREKWQKNFNWMGYNCKNHLLSTPEVLNDPNEQ